MDFWYGLMMVALRSVASVVVLFIISRVSGPRQIAQLTFYDYIVGISIGSIAAMAVEDSIPLTDMFISMIMFGGFAMIISYVSNKSIVIRRLFSGKPSIMIYKGKIIKHSLKKNHYDVNDLLMSCRQQGYFKVEDIEFAILEDNGQFSIMPKSDKQPLTPYDMSIKKEPNGLEYTLIIDGKVMKENLKYYGKDETWLNAKLKEQKINSVKEVILAIGADNNMLITYLMNEALPHHHFFI